LFIPFLYELRAITVWVLLIILTKNRLIIELINQLLATSINEIQLFFAILREISINFTLSWFVDLWGGLTDSNINIVLNPRLLDILVIRNE
jgi:hypothetical protein